MSKLIDLTGQTFNYLTVIKRAQNTKDGRAQWLCRCKCGNELIVLGKSLRNGHTKSCGCYKKEVLQKRLLLDLTGKKFGNLTALELMPENFNNRKKRYWKCQCDCGNITYVETQHLTHNEILSCGCQNTSKGEQIIKILLQKNNIPFEKEKTFETCVFPDSGYKAKFDFFVNNEYLIQFDGEQHFYYNTSLKSWNTKQNYEKTKKRDEYKNNWCIENHIPLIRIPYTHLNKLCFNDLLLETSEFVL